MICSAAFADQIVVVDSGTDRTCEIARELGAEVFEHPDWQRSSASSAIASRSGAANTSSSSTPTNRSRPNCSARLYAVASGRDALWEVLWNQVAYGRPPRLRRAPAACSACSGARALERYEGVV